MAAKFLPFAVLLSLVILAGASSSSSSSPLVAPLRGSEAGSYDCVYTLYVETGWVWKAGTDAAIGATLRAADGGGFTVRDLAKWGGLMGAGHDYYERGSVDIFSGRAPCLASPPCALNLTSDGSGPHHGWYCKSVEVAATGPHLGCARRLFAIDQWLATDAPPYQLYAERSVCARSGRSGAGRSKDGGGAQHE